MLCFIPNLKCNWQQFAGSIQIPTGTYLPAVEPERQYD